MNIDQLRALWHERRGEEAPTALSKDLIARALAYWAQEERLGGLSPRLLRLLASVSNTGSTPNTPSQGRLCHCPRVSGQAPRGDSRTRRVLLAGTSLLEPVDRRPEDHRDKLERPSLLWSATDGRSSVRYSMFSRPYHGTIMKPVLPKPQRCAIYTRKSTEHNLDLAFNSLDAQREACEAYIKSQAHEGWRLIAGRFDDGGLSGASLERPALQSLLDQVRARKIDIIVVYKVDRLTRSLADFAKLVELFDEYGVSFVSITQSFNTTSSMGRLTLNVLLSFAQFEREVIGERVRDKIAASKRKGIWVGGPVSLGYRSVDKKLEVVPDEAKLVQKIFADYLRVGSIGALAASLDREQIRPRPRTLSKDRHRALHGRPARPYSQEPLLHR